MAKSIRGENGKAIEISLYEGQPYLWITTNSTGWSVTMPAATFASGVRSGEFQGTSDKGAPRRLTILIQGPSTNLRIHHPTSGSGVGLTVDSESFAKAIAEL